MKVQFDFCEESLLKAPLWNGQSDEILVQGLKSMFLTTYFSPQR